MIEDSANAAQKGGLHDKKVTGRKRHWSIPSARC
jgi:hypothetical protein